MMTSSGVIMPRSPWLASLGWTKKAGVPVDAKVAATFRATWPDLPMPVTINRPCAPEIKSTAAMKARPSPSWMAAASVVSPVASTSSVRTAEAISSPLRALIRRSVLSALGIEIRQYAKAGDLRPSRDTISALAWLTKA
jgi:hypothetical protein